MPRCAARVAMLAALLTGCGSSDGMAPYVILRVEDPNHIAATGAGEDSALALIDASGNSSRFDDLPGDFPLTVTLTSERRGPQVVTVELYRAGAVVGRGNVTIDVEAQNTQETPVALDFICVFSAEGCSPPEHQPEEEEEPAGPIEPRQCNKPWDCDDGLFCNGTETCADGVCVSGLAPCANQMVCDEDVGCTTPTNPCIKKVNGTEIQPDGTTCARESGDTGMCYAGECVALDYSVSCDEGLSLGFFADGQILGGVGHGMTVNHLQFPQVDDNGYNPQWVVENDDIRPGDAGGPAATSYTIYALAPYRLASFRIRTQEGVRCRFTTDPQATATDVSSTSFATIQLDVPSSGTGTQMVRFEFTCDAGGLSQLRIDDFCLVEVP